MPWKSTKQERWGNSPSGIKAMGKSAVSEFNSASKGMKLPSSIKNSHKTSSAVHNPIGKMGKRGFNGMKVGMEGMN